jgi:hypothetical protein
VGGQERQVIELRLMRPHDMFEMPQADLFSEYRNFLTGIDFCISELRGRASRRPVRLEINLPVSQIDDDLSTRMERTMRRYCDHRMRYNLHEGRANRLSGVSALRVGLPIAVIGLIMTAFSAHIEPDTDPVKLVTDHLGWVLAWLGLWFPLDSFVFFPLTYGRENRVLRLLRDAEINVTPRPDVAGPVPA